MAPRKSTQYAADKAKKALEDAKAEAELTPEPAREALKGKLLSIEAWAEVDALTAADLDAPEMTAETDAPKGDAEEQASCTPKGTLDSTTGGPAPDATPATGEKKRRSRRPLAALLGAAESKLTSFDLRADAAREALKGKLLSIEVERVDYLAALPEAVRDLLEAGGLAARQTTLPGAGEKT